MIGHRFARDFGMQLREWGVDMLAEPAGALGAFVAHPRSGSVHRAAPGIRGHRDRRTIAMDVYALAITPRPRH